MRSANEVRRGKQKEESSAEVIASNDDLLTELLLWLPVKSLLRFKSVSKHWLSLISDPHFARRKYLKSNAVSALYLDCMSLEFGEEHYEVVPLDPSETGVPLEHLDFAGHPRRIIIEQSCNGLLLLRSLDEDKYYVYNPTTKQSKTLPCVPPVPAFGAEMQDRGPSLAFDPSKSHFYKVVDILRRESDYNYHCQIVIYSSETGRWRVSGAPFTPVQLVGFWTGVYCNGAIHWVSLTDASLYFDLNEELVGEMPMPPLLDDFKQARRYFGESSGRLYHVESYEYLTTHLDVYEMEIDRSGWFLKFRVDPELLGRFTMPSERIHLMSVLYVARGEKQEDSFVVLYLSNEMIIQYNFVSQTHQEIFEIDFPMNDLIHVSRPAYPYIESLSLV